MKFSMKISIVVSLVASSLLKTTAENISVAGANHSELYVIMGIYQSAFLHYQGSVITCPRSYFTSDEQKQLDYDILKNEYLIMKQEWWLTKTDVGCKLIQYGGKGPEKDQCSGVSFDDNKTHMQSLSSLHSNFEQYDKGSVFKYIYGTRWVDADGAFHGACDKPVFSSDSLNWASDSFGDRFGPNSNTFVSCVLQCGYLLSDEKPQLGVSDLKGVTCDYGSRGIDYFSCTATLVGGNTALVV